MIDPIQHKNAIMHSRLLQIPEGRMRNRNWTKIAKTFLCDPRVLFTSFRKPYSVLKERVTTMRLRLQGKTGWQEGLKGEEAQITI
jgi:hypothetical protein